MNPFAKRPAITVGILAFLYVCWHPYLTMHTVWMSLLAVVILGVISFSVQVYVKELRQPLEWITYILIPIAHVCVYHETVKYGVPPSTSVLFLCCLCLWIAMPWPGDKKYD